MREIFLWSSQAAYCLLLLLLLLAPTICPATKYLADTYTYIAADIFVSLAVASATLDSAD